MVSLIYCIINLKICTDLEKEPVIIFQVSFTGQISVFLKHFPNCTNYYSLIYYTIDILISLRFCNQLSKINYLNILEIYKSLQFLFDLLLACVAGLKIAFRLC